MCIICVSRKGIRQPNEFEIKNMWESNPHGAGYMFFNKDEKKVEIHKGFMNLKDFMRSVNEEEFTDDDVVVYHFRISTQAGVNPQMTHPFPLSDDLKDMEILDCLCDVGIAHNGIIRITSKKGADYSDTALFITQYLPALIRDTADITDKAVKRCISELADSKLALLNNDGELTLIGNFQTDGSGLVYSNGTYQPARQFNRTWNLIYDYSDDWAYEDYRPSIRKAK